MFGSGRKTLLGVRKDIPFVLSPKKEGDFRKGDSAGTYLMSGFSSRERRSTLHRERVTDYGRPSCMIKVKLSDDLVHLL